MKKIRASKMLTNAIDTFVPPPIRMEFAAVILRVHVLESQLEFIRNNTPPKGLKLLDMIEDDLTEKGTDAYMESLIKAVEPH